jgi:hypothetical protein
VRFGGFREGLTEEGKTWLGYVGKLGRMERIGDG